MQIIKIEILWWEVFCNCTLGYNYFFCHAICPLPSKTPPPDPMWLLIRWKETQKCLPLKEATSDGDSRVPWRLNSIAPLHGPNKVTKPSLYAPTENFLLLRMQLSKLSSKPNKHITKNQNRYITIVFHVNVSSSGQDTE